MGTCKHYWLGPMDISGYSILQHNSHGLINDTAGLVNILMGVTTRLA